MQLGAFTDTEDAEGEIIETRPYEDLNKGIVARKAKEFLGEIEQIPPMHSAVKIQGQPLYKLARKGIEIERRPRRVRIDRFEVRTFDPPLVTFEVTCSKGTYVRTLCRNLAEALGTAGHLAALRRTRSGRFSLAEARPLEDIKKTVIGEKPPGFLSMEEGMSEFSGCEVSSAAADRLLNGIPPALSELEEKPDCGEGDIVVLRKKHSLLAVSRFAPQRRQEKRGDFELLKVFNQR
jgi:tRNA pseudouridine55 synthase